MLPGIYLFASFIYGVVCQLAGEASPRAGRSASGSGAGGQAKSGAKPLPRPSIARQVTQTIYTPWTGEKGEGVVGERLVHCRKKICDFHHV
jgi:hypothetical protein